MNTEISTLGQVNIYALVGSGELLPRKSPDEFIKDLKLNAPVLVPKQKFQKMWPIFKSVCDLYKEDAVSVYRKNKTRDRNLVEIRFLSMTLFRSNLTKNDYDNNYSLRVCGEFFGKDHCTVIHAINTIENLRKVDKGFKLFTNPLFNE